MSDTEEVTKEDTEIEPEKEELRPSEVNETVEDEEEVIEETKQMTPEEIGNLLFNIMCAIRGVDPKQVQGMAKFMNVDSVDETSYYATQRTSVSIAQLRMFGESFYKGEEWNEYELCADLLGIGFKGFKGFKSDQWKDIASGVPNLDKIGGLPEEVQKGVLGGLLSRGGKE